LWYPGSMRHPNSSPGSSPTEPERPIAQESYSQPGESAANDRDVIDAELLDEAANRPVDAALVRPRPRRKWVPITLFVLTCFSTFFVGACNWMPLTYIEMAAQSQSLMPFRRVLLRHWDEGLLYMACVLAILFAHEMGHFVATLLHRVRASLPYFLPIPFSPIGTLGAVIMMDGRRADRRQMFDIGIAGPLAGMVLAVPIMWYGVATLDLTTSQHGYFVLDSPIAVQYMLDEIQPTGYESGDRIWISQVNPFFMAGWIGFLITGLNMIPVSQLDGGHIIYTLFGKWAHWIARAFMVLVIALVVYDVQTWGIWSVMVLLVLLMGTDHPPTKNDNARLGWFRIALGLTSLAIPVLCFPPRALIVLQ